MRKFLAFILLAVPFISSAQMGPQMQISNLQTGEVSYHEGQEITGSFVLNNIGEENIPDIQYYVSVGNYGEKLGGPLENEAYATPLSEALYIPMDASLEVPFKITPANLPSGDLGIQITAMQKNGFILSQDKIPLVYEGERTNLSTIIKGYYDLDGGQYPLQSNPPFAKGEVQSFFLVLPEGMEDGTRDVKLTVYKKRIGQDVVFDQTIAVDFVDGEGEILLPEDMKANSYAGQVSLAEGSNVLTLSYSIAGPQAQVMSIDTDALSLKKGQDFVVTLTYADTPLNGRDPMATEYPEGLAARIKILNEKGDVVTQHEQPLEITQKQELLLVDEDSTEEEQAEATKRLDIMLNNERVIEIPVTADVKAKSLSFEVELYDTKTGDVYDTYKTSFPETEKEYPARGVLLVTFAVILILLIIIFKAAKHKIPMVCLTLVLGAGVAGLVIVQHASAQKVLEQKGWLNSHKIRVDKPLGADVYGYDTGTQMIPFDVTVDGYAAGSNGFLAHYVRYPIYTSTWASFISANSAMSHLQANHKKSTIYNSEKKTATFDKTFNVLYAYSTNGGTNAPALTPGKHYLPFSTMYCTASHGCSSPTFVVFALCQDGIGVCPGETQTADVCPYMNGTLDPTVQGSVPSGYVKVGDDCRNNCAVNMGEACGCPGNMGTILCDGSCSVSTSCSALDVTCTPSPASIVGDGQVTFTAIVNDAAPGAVTYEWDNNSANNGSTYTKLVTGGGQLVYLDVTDSAGNNDDATCSAGYTENTSCSEATKPNDCSKCLSNGTWDTTVCSADTTITAGFSFRPNIVAPGGTCKLDLEAQNVLSCRLVRTAMGGSVVATVSADASHAIDVDSGYNINIGTYRLECQGIDPEDTYVTIGSPKQCIAAPVIVED